MIDYYALLAVGLALFIGSIPLMFKRFRSGDFLVSYVDNEEASQDNKQTNGDMAE